MVSQHQRELCIPVLSKDAVYFLFTLKLKNCDRETRDWLMNCPPLRKILFPLYCFTDLDVYESFITGCCDGSRAVMKTVKTALILYSIK